MRKLPRSWPECQDIGRVLCKLVPGCACMEVTLSSIVVLPPSGRRRSGLAIVKLPMLVFNGRIRCIAELAIGCWIVTIRLYRTQQHLGLKYRHGPQWEE